jgi:TRAP transporter 4TM/12TM fusion protein
MGAGAFVMSEFLQVPYLRIAAAAAIPAAIYYLALYFNVHCRAQRRGLKGLPERDLPNATGVLLHDGHLLIPLGVVLYALLSKYTPLAAAFWGVISIFAVSFLRPHTRMNIRDLLKTMEEGARSALGVALACAMVGFIVGTSSLTGLGFVISNNIIELAHGRLFFTLLLGMVACLVLGMGLPTTANYIVTSTIIAPALIKMHILPLAAHMFVFYFGIMADLTPPVCLAAYTGAGIAGANPTQTGFQATRIALVAYLLPFTFIYSPAILLEDPNLPYLALLIVSAVVGVVGISGAFQGWLFCRLGLLVRGLLLASGVAVFFPQAQYKTAALVVLAVAFFVLWWRARASSEIS